MKITQRNFICKYTSSVLPCNKMIFLSDDSWKSTTSPAETAVEKKNATILAVSQEAAEAELLPPRLIALNKQRWAVL